MDKSWRVILAFVGIFIAGTVAGGLIAFRIFHNAAERRGGPSQSRIPGQPPQLGPQLIRRLTDQLDLTEEQREKIKPIEARMTEELRRLRRETQHETELVIEKAQDEISAELTPAQRAQFEERIAKGRERIKKFMQDQEQRFRRDRDPGAPKRQHDEPPPPPK